MLIRSLGLAIAVAREASWHACPPSAGDGSGRCPPARRRSRGHHHYPEPAELRRQPADCPCSPSLSGTRAAGVRWPPAPRANAPARGPRGSGCRSARSCGGWPGCAATWASCPRYRADAASWGHRGVRQSSSCTSRWWARWLQRPRRGWCGRRFGSGVLVRRSTGRGSSPQGKARTRTRESVVPFTIAADCACCHTAVARHRLRIG